MWSLAVQHSRNLCIWKKAGEKLFKRRQTTEHLQPFTGRTCLLLIFRSSELASERTVEKFTLEYTKIFQKVGVEEAGVKWKCSLPRTKWVLSAASSRHRRRGRPAPLQACRAPLVLLFSVKLPPSE